MKTKNQTVWDEMDAAAEREAMAMAHAFHTAGIAMKSQRGGVYRTTRGGGDGAAARPASKRFDSEVKRLTR
jgi:hypothetical protein